MCRSTRSSRATRPKSRPSRRSVKQDRQLIDSNLELTNEDEAEELERSLDALSLERTVKVSQAREAWADRQIIRELVAMHRHDQNFSGELLGHMIDFLHDPSIIDNPEKHPEIIHEMKLEALLATTNSPYVEVRANVDPDDDPTMPVSTIRAWFIGVVFCCAGTFIDTLFAFRQPSISVGVNVAQLLACKPIVRLYAALLTSQIRWESSLRECCRTGGSASSATR